MAMGAAEWALNTLLTEGSLESQLPNMQHRADLYDLVDYAEYTEFDASIFNFTVVPRS
jgi:methylisocitrate lyase